jgi:NAD(P)-dependent dehydrogenase (short-subunit alcohol dehydrogenase family)
MTFASIVDAVLEAPVAPSFTKIGYAARKRLEHWTPLDDYDLGDRTIVVTGATSGLGKHAAGRFAALGAHVVIVGRDPDKTAQVADQLRAASRAGTVTSAIADLGDLDAVRALATTLRADHPAIDTLVHNAGALSAERRVNSDGIEVTVASQVLGPFLLTSLLLPVLETDTATGRVITVSSGGMYAAGLTVGRLQMSERDYKGSEQYARAKRAQVTLNEMWAQRVPASQVVFHAMHPGWADTPGVEEALPTFRKLTGPLLRSVEEGADTMVWLAADDAALASSGDFWHDRRRRSIHKLPTTRKADTPERRADLWAWCIEQTGAVTP